MAILNKKSYLIENLIIIDNDTFNAFFKIYLEMRDYYSLCLVLHLIPQKLVLQNLK
jgi:hypothetical protein